MRRLSPAGVTGRPLPVQTHSFCECQRKILDVVIELGYYGVSRQGAHEDIAGQVDLDPGTVSEHARKIEVPAFDSLAG